jgi:hypothetical protein
VPTSSRPMSREEPIYHISRNYAANRLHDRRSSDTILARMTPTAVWALASAPSTNEPFGQE